MIKLIRNTIAIDADIDIIMSNGGFLDDAFFTADFELPSNCPIFPTPIGDVVELFAIDFQQKFACRAILHDGTDYPCEVTVTKIEGKIATCTATFRAAPAELFQPLAASDDDLLRVTYDPTWTAATEGVNFDDIRLKRARYHNGLKIATNEGGKPSYHIPAMSVRDWAGVINQISGREVVGGMLSDDVYLVPLSFVQCHATPRIATTDPTGEFSHVGGVREPSFVTATLGRSGEIGVWTAAYGIKITKPGVSTCVLFRVTCSGSGSYARITSGGDVLVEVSISAGATVDFFVENLTEGEYVLEFKKFAHITTFDCLITYYDMVAENYEDLTISALRKDYPTTTAWLRGFGDTTPAEILNDYCRLSGYMLTSDGDKVQVAQPSVAVLPQILPKSAEIDFYAAHEYRYGYNNDDQQRGGADYDARDHVMNPHLRPKPYMRVLSATDGEEVEKLTADGFTGIKRGDISGIYHYCGRIANTSSDNTTSNGKGYVIAIGVDNGGEIDLQPYDYQPATREVDNLMHVVADVATMPASQQVSYFGQLFAIEEIESNDGFFELNLLKLQ